MGNVFIYIFSIVLLFYWFVWMRQANKSEWHMDTSHCTLWGWGYKSGKDLNSCAKEPIIQITDRPHFSHLCGNTSSCICNDSCLWRDILLRRNSQCSKCLPWFVKSSPLCLTDERGIVMVRWCFTSRSPGSRVSLQYNHSLEEPAQPSGRRHSHSLQMVPVFVFVWVWVRERENVSQWL